LIESWQRVDAEGLTPCIDGVFLCAWAGGNRRKKVPDVRLAGPGGRAKYGLRNPIQRFGGKCLEP